MDEFYKLLEIDVNASQEEIKKAYRKKAQKFHPDKGGDPELFKKINHAYDSLLNKKNDNDIFTFFQHVKLSPTITILDISLEQLCTRQIIQFDINVDVKCECLNFSKSCHQCNGKGILLMKIHNILTIQQPCSNCKGSGKIFTSCDKCSDGLLKKHKKFPIHLNPSLENGYKYMFKNEGNQDINGFQADLIIVLRYKEHENFKVQNNNLIHKIKISLKESLCGYEREIKHPSGEILQIISDKVISPKSKNIIEFQGLTESGNMIIEHTIIFPENINQETKKILSKYL
jgi:DnaJ family protein A protein 2